MKKAFLSLFFYLNFINMYAQDKSDLYGEWYLSYIDHDPTNLKLTKLSSENGLDQFYQMGRFIAFKEDGTYDENASARCGLDDNRYHYTGKWTYDPQTKIIALSDIKVLNGRPNIYSHYKVMSSGKIQIASLGKDTLTGKIIKPWEKVFPKNK